MQVTATLKDWHRGTGYYYNCYWGSIFNDSKRRWRDGTVIHTSNVRDKVDQGDHFLLFTLNSVYILPKGDMRNDTVVG